MFIFNRYLRQTITCFIQRKKSEDIVNFLRSSSSFCSTLAKSMILLNILHVQYMYHVLNALIWRESCMVTTFNLIKRLSLLAISSSSPNALCNCPPFSHALMAAATVGYDVSTARFLK